MLLCQFNKGLIKRLMKADEMKKKLSICVFRRVNGMEWKFFCGKMCSDFKSFVFKRDCTRLNCLEIDNKLYSTGWKFLQVLLFLLLLYFEYNKEKLQIRTSLKIQQLTQLSLHYVSHLLWMNRAYSLNCQTCSCLF